jgi:hypothetical protein
LQVQKSEKNVKSKKNQKLSQEEESNAGRDGQSSSGCTSDDDASQETNGGEHSESKDSAALNLSGKMRATRGSATDPQSLYARVRKLTQPPTPQHGKYITEISKVGFELKTSDSNIMLNHNLFSKLKLIKKYNKI